MKLSDLKFKSLIKNSGSKIINVINEVMIKEDLNFAESVFISSKSPIKKT